MSRFRTWKRSLIPKLAPLVTFIVRSIGRTLKLQTVGYERFKDFEGPVIYCSWHGRSFIGALLFQGLGFWVLVSNSRDGEMQSRIFGRLGYRSIRGSTGREGVRAALEAISVLKSGAKIALTPDGPRGPSGIVQEGILMMAMKSGALIVPLGSSAKRRWIINSWDRYMVPKPFSKAIMIFGEPITVPAGSTKEEQEAIRLRLQDSINALEFEAERQMGHA